MRNKSLSVLAFSVWLPLLMTSCASVASKGALDPTAAAPEDGVIYFMPKRGFKVTVTLDKDKNQTPTVTATDTIADVTKRFVLQYNQSYFGTNHLVVSVNNKGLLQSSNASTTSSVETIAKNLGTTLGSIQGLSMILEVPPVPAAPSCAANQSYTLIVYPEDLINGAQVGPICNFMVSGTAVTATSANPMRKILPNPLSNSTKADGARFESGIFYKHDLPYILNVYDTVNKVQSEWLVYSPDQSEIDFIPATKTFFANSQTNITLSDGALTNVDASSDGELVGLLSLPADVISAYFTAIGGIFSSFNTVSTNEKTLTTDQQSLLLTQIKYQVCLSAIMSNPLAGKTGAALSMAEASIQAACQ